jgi:hypothetical protein
MLKEKKRLNKIKLIIYLLTKNKQPIKFHNIYNYNLIMFHLKRANYFFQNLNKKRFSTDLNLILPNQKNFSIALNETTTFSDLENELKKKIIMEKLEFKTWDHTTISKGNDLKTYFQNENMFFYRSGNMEWQMVSNKDIETIKHNDNLENLKKDYEFQKITELVNKYNQSNLTSDELFSIYLKIFKIRNLSDVRNYKNISELFNEY